jgi:hypothetical protein
MTVRRNLKLGMLALLLLGGAFAAVPFISYLGPSERARAEGEFRVTTADVPVGGVKEIDWAGQRVFVTHTDKFNVFLVPYRNGAYQLPDVTWDRPFIPCRFFGMKDGVFSCTDPETPEWWTTNARWDMNGKSQNQPFEDMRHVPFLVVAGDVVVESGR